MSTTLRDIKPLTTDELGELERLFTDEEISNGVDPVESGRRIGLTFKGIAYSLKVKIGLYNTRLNDDIEDTPEQTDKWSDRVGKDTVRAIKYYDEYLKRAFRKTSKKSKLKK